MSCPVHIAVPAGPWPQSLIFASAQSTVSGLTTGCSYSFQGALTNEAGFTSPYSNATVALVAAPPSPPVVARVAEGEFPSTSIDVFISLSGDGGANVTAIIVSWALQSNFDMEAGSLTLPARDFEQSDDGLLRVNMTDLTECVARRRTTRLRLLLA